MMLSARLITTYLECGVHNDKAILIQFDLIPRIRVCPVLLDGHLDDIAVIGRGCSLSFLSVVALRNTLLLIGRKRQVYHLLLRHS
jgi:hypothetical protein